MPKLHIPTSDIKMDIIDYTMDRFELVAFADGRPGKLDKIWADIVGRLPQPLQAEAWAKGFSIQEIGELATRSTRVFDLFVRNPSPELRHALEYVYTQVLYLD